MLKFLIARCLVLGLLVPGLASRSAAQPLSLYYQEAVKDGRIYVFNTPERYKTWQASGEAGTAIILVGRGSGGETVVAENETAADLYFFKHDLPGYERPLPKVEKPFDDRVVYRDGRTTLQMKNATLSLTNRIQGRYTYFDRLQNDRGSFRIRRAQTVFEATAYTSWRFRVQTNWVGASVVNSVSLSTTGTPRLSTSATRGAILEDAEIFWARYPLATVWFGQGKAYFARQELTSDSRLQFLERWVGNARFAPGRDQGIGLFGVDAAKHFEYNLGLYNGNLINQVFNDNVEYMYAGRFVWTPFGEYRLEESVHDYPEKPKLAVGVSGLYNTLTRSEIDTDLGRFGSELAFKWRGFSTTGEFFYEDAQRQGTDFASRGYYMQAGWLFSNRKFELAGRYGVFDDEVGLLTLSDLNANPLREAREIGAAASWYFDRHIHKLQANWIRIEDTVNDRLTDEFAAQLQAVF